MSRMPLALASDENGPYSNLDPGVPCSENTGTPFGSPSSSTWSCLPSRTGTRCSTTRNLARNSRVRSDRGVTLFADQGRAKQNDAAAAWTTQPMSVRAEPSSPAIRALQEECRLGDGAAEAHFWASTAKSGAPLLERIPRDTPYRWVTYLFRGNQKIRYVGLFSPQTPLGSIERLERIPRTQVWYRTFRTRSDCHGVYSFLLKRPTPGPFDLERYYRSWRSAVPDPLNPAVFDVPKDPEFPDHPLRGTRESVLRLPKAPHPAELTERSGVRKGQLRLFRVTSKALGNTRRVWHYTPAGGQRPSRRGPLVIFFDGFDSLNALSAPVILDNLVHSRRVPPTAALFIDQLDLATRDHELPCYEPFGRFLMHEFLPWARRTLDLSPSPSQTVLAGSSYGGLAATYWALRYPGTFRKVISQSGSFGWSPPGVDEPAALAREFMRRPHLPLKIHMDVGRYEARSGDENEVSDLAANRHLRDVLRLKGYSLRYREFCGTHDYYCWRNSLVDALRWILATPKAAR